MDFQYKRVLVTGGTGSFGQKFIAEALRRFPQIERLVVFSRDELKQYEMAKRFPEHKFPQLRFFLGDVRDAGRLQRACESVDLIVHAAALKQVPAAEYNPIEFIKTNVIGAENIVNAALDSQVKCVVALSTDKAAAPVNLYGATKLCSDKLFIAANNFKGKRDLRFSVVRYGNVLGSRGSVIPFFLEKRKTGVLPITHPEMTRFSITVQEGVDRVFNAISDSWGGELFVPKIPSYKIMTVAQAVGPNCRVEEVGIRPGEKLHEEMITENDSLNTYECANSYVVIPASPQWDVQDWCKRFKAVKVAAGFKYNSLANTEWLSVEDLRALIKTHLDPSFAP
jgi:UDP-N-acetylglucosamine 4,6-dehydratase (inverting)